eukprot:13153158-Alexandrium_andersonii.AAC.1
MRLPGSMVLACALAWPMPLRPHMQAPVSLSFILLPPRHEGWMGQGAAPRPPNGLMDEQDVASFAYAMRA